MSVLANPVAGAEVGSLRCNSLSKWYGQVAALTDVGLEVGPGVVGLVGRNGAGKSTLMKLAAGLLWPSQGTVTVCGRSPTSVQGRALLGFAPDVDRLYEALAGHEFVAWMLRLHGVSRRVARDRAGQVLAELGLEQHMHRQIREYSKGMRQRIRLAQALAHGPRVVLLDEPMSGLDPVARHELGRHIAALGRAGAAVLVSSHVLHELEAMVDRVVLVHQGRLLAEGRVQDLRGQISEQPHRLRLASREPRRLAARLLQLPQVEGVAIAAGVLEVAVTGQPGFYGVLSAIGAEPDGLVDEVLPLDDSLASVFGYLIG
jgi:ABC-2 type transport system ATP-binding protein